MSQSDYIRYKRVSTTLRDLSSNPTNFPPIISQSDYTDFTNFTMVNTVVNTNINYNEILPTNTIKIFGIPVTNPTNCWTYPLCINTDKRPNRIPPKDIDLSNNLQNIIPILPRKYVKHPTNINSMSCLNNNNGAPFANPQTPFSKLNPRYKIYSKSANTSNTNENSTFNTNTIAYGNRRLNQLRCNECSKICPLV
jgi:hypothetical protein